MTAFSEKLTEIRKNSGETQDMLGEAIGVSGKTVSKWENGTCEPDLATVVKLAQHYKTTADVLLGLSNDGNMEKIILDDLTKDSTVAGVFRKAFEHTVIETRMMGRALNLFPENDFMTNTNAAIPDYRNGEIERQIMHSDRGCQYAIFTDDMNLTVGLYRNKNEFAWLKNDADKLAKLFGFFADADALKILYNIERADYPKEFTAEYTAKTIGISTEKAEKILDELVSITSNDQFCVFSHEVELVEGVRKAYSFGGNGLLLALCTVACNILRGVKINSGWNSNAKLIGSRDAKGEQR